MSGLRLTDEEFDVVASIIRTKASTRMAAKLVLVHGMGSTEAGKEHGLGPQQVNNTCARIEKAHIDICKGYARKVIT